jgi:hypothetical protein
MTEYYLHRGAYASRFNNVAAEEEMNNRFKKVFKIVAIAISLTAFAAALTGFVKMRNTTMQPQMPKTSAVQDAGVLAGIEKGLIVS